MSGLQTNRMFPVDVSHKDEVRHRRLLAEAINELAACAFTPETQLEARDTPFALPAAHASVGVNVTVTPYVPARAHLLLLVYFINNGVATDLNVELRLKENGVVLDTWALPTIPAGVNFQQFWALQLLRPELVQDTTYTYQFEAFAGALEDGDIVAPTSLSVRLEPRRRV